MAAHRYWRAVGLEAYGAGDLELSEFHLLAAGVRVDAPATLTSNIAPDVSGALANLQDDVLTTAARWSANAVKTLVLSWDFGGSPADVDDIRLAGGSEVRFLLIGKIQYSDDAATWSDLAVVAGVKWPGVSVKTTSSGVLGGDAYAASVMSLVHFDGADLSSTFTDAAGKIWTPAGAAKISTAQSKFGGASGLFNGSTDWLSTPNSADFAFGTAPYTVELWYRPTGVAAYASLFATGDYAFSQLSLRVTDTGKIQIFHNEGAGLLLAGATTLSAGAWVNIVVCRGSDATTRIFLNGNIDASSAISYDVTNGGTKAWVGAQTVSGTPSFPANGYIDELRVTKGVGRYTSAFTPQAASFFLTGAGILVNTVKGRSAPSDVLSIGTGPAIVYGIPQITPPIYLGVETGSVKDYTTGVLGQGIGRVRGTIKEKGTPDAPVYRRVRLIRERDGLVIREQWSDKVTGAYDFKYVDEAQIFTVVTYDHLHNYRAVVADNITPEIMP